MYIYLFHYIIVSFFVFFSLMRHVKHILRYWLGEVATGQPLSELKLTNKQ